MGQIAKEIWANSCRLMSGPYIFRTKKGERHSAFPSVDKAAGKGRIAGDSL